MQVKAEKIFQSIVLAMFFWIGLFFVGKIVGHIHNHMDDIVNFIRL